MDETRPDVLVESERATARRRQVLDAAALCFRRHGFHACSMAEIAAEAGMSVGHIYRYFPGKDAIIAAIVRQDVDHVLERIAAFPVEAPDIRRKLTEGMTAGVKRELLETGAALWIDVRAEAVRQPAIAAVVREGDAKVGQKLRGILRAGVERTLSEVELDARIELFHLMFQGLILRRAINPDLSDETIEEIVRITVLAAFA